MRIARLLTATSVALALCASIAGAQPPTRARTQARTQARPRPTASDELRALRAAIEASAARMADAFNRGDMDGFIAPYAPEIWVFPPNAEPFQGRAAAQEFFARGHSQGTRNLQLTTTGLDRSGYLAYETGTYTSDFPTPGQAGQTSRDYGKYVHIWKRDARGEWRIHLATWSSNVPPAPMPR